MSATSLFLTKDEKMSRELENYEHILAERLFKNRSQTHFDLPDNEVIIRVLQKIDKFESPIAALEFLMGEEWDELLWLALIISWRYLFESEEKSVEEFIKEYMNNMENAFSPFSGEYADEHSDFLSKSVRGISELVKVQFMRIGSNWVNLKRVCRESAPTPPEQSRTFWMIGKLLERNVNLEDALRLAGDAAIHPWMKLFCALAIQSMKKETNFENAILSALAEFRKNRVDKHMSDIEIGMTLEHKFIYPNFTDIFIHPLLGVGAETNNLSSVFLLMGQERAPIDASPSVIEFLKVLRNGLHTGLPLLRVLTISIFPFPLRDEIKKICEKIMSGSFLSEAITWVDERLNTKEVVGIIRAGECCRTGEYHDNLKWALTELL